MKIGIDLGGSHIAVGLVDDNYQIVEKRTFYMSNRGNKSYEKYIIFSIIKGIKELLECKKISLNEIEKIGIATPGNPKDGIIKNVVNLEIKEFNIVKNLKSALENKNISISVENDGKCAGLAEKYIGSLKNYSDCVFLCIGTGIGGAAFINNKFLKPKRNSAFEFGHMVIKKDGEICKCGNRGCFEAYCSKRKFKEKMQDILKIDEYIDSYELTKIVKENLINTEIKKVLKEYIDNLTLGIANIINILEPEAISIGGSMSNYEELILENLRKRINNGEYLFNKENPPKIIIAQAGNDAGIIGATCSIKS